MSKDTQHGNKSHPQLPSGSAAVDTKQSSAPNFANHVTPELDEKLSPREAAMKEEKRRKSFVDISKFMKVIKGNKDKDKDKDLSGDESEMPEVKRSSRSDKEKDKELRKAEREKERERYREEKDAKKKSKQEGKDPGTVSFAANPTSPRTNQQISDEIIRSAISRVQSFDVVSEEIGSTISSMASEPEEYSVSKFIADNAKTKYSGGVTKVKLEEGQTEEDWEICKLADHTWAGKYFLHIFTITHQL
jgi:hypothetical protein